MAKQKSPTLIQNCQGVSEMLPKFSLFISNRAAAAKRPTTAGRRPWKVFSTALWFLYFIRNLLMISMSTKLGKTTAKVAMKLPRIPHEGSYPAFTTAVYPTYVALLMPIGPGVL